MNDYDMNQFKPTSTTVKEIPYHKNNPRAQEGDPKSAAANDESQMTEKQKRIAALKQSLLAPQLPRKKPAPGV